MLEVGSTPTPSLEIERIIQLRKELEELEKIGRAGANEELTKAVAAADEAIRRCELIATTFKLNFTLSTINTYPEIEFYGDPTDTMDGMKTGWLSSSDFC